MSASIRLIGLEAAKTQLASMGKSVGPVLRGAIDTTAVDVRRRKYVPPMAPMFKNRRFVASRIILKKVRLRKKIFDARLIPSSSGVYVTEFRRWGFLPVSPTRARIIVGSFKGSRVAAGFVNPASFARQPWRTRTERRTAKRTYRYESALKPAIGPSIAFFFKRLTNRDTLQFANRRLQNEFQRRYRKELIRATA